MSMLRLFHAVQQPAVTVLRYLRQLNGGGNVFIGCVRVQVCLCVRRHSRDFQSTANNTNATRDTRSPFGSKRSHVLGSFVNSDKQLCACAD